MKALKKWYTAVLLLMCGINAADAQTAWTKCADEGGVCSFTGAKDLRYGFRWTGQWSAVRTLTGPVSCNNDALPPDPAVGYGKECQIRDASVTVPPVVVDPPPVVDPPVVTLPPSGMLTPLTEGEDYVVTWVPPTVNTDGTPIGTITKTEVQASTSSDFATYYQWDATNPNSSSVSVLNGPTGTVYWRARVWVGPVSSDFTASAITEREWVAQTRPTCWPKPFGAGTWLKASQNSDGFALYWQCGDKHSGFVGTWASLEPDWMAQLSAAIEAGSFSALWDSKITGPSQASKYATVQPLWAALRDANPIPAGPVYAVALRGSYSDRPAYLIVDGVRTSKSAGRVGIGRPCDCVAFKEGNYCAVTGQPNVQTPAVDVLATSAAICAEVK